MSYEKYLLKIKEFKAAHPGLMSNTKWQKLFAALRDFSISEREKLESVLVAHIFAVRRPPTAELLEPSAHPQWERLPCAEDFIYDIHGQLVINETVWSQPYQVNEIREIAIPYAEKKTIYSRGAAPAVIENILFDPQQLTAYLDKIAKFPYVVMDNYTQYLKEDKEDIKKTGHTMTQFKLIIFYGYVRDKDCIFC